MLFDLEILCVLCALCGEDFVKKNPGGLPPGFFAGRFSNFVGDHILITFAA